MSGNTAGRCRHIVSVYMNPQATAFRADDGPHDTSSSNVLSKRSTFRAGKNSVEGGGRSGAITCRRRSVTCQTSLTLMTQSSRR